VNYQFAGEAYRLAHSLQTQFLRSPGLAAASGREAEQIFPVCPQNWALAAGTLR
jgi:hypothetical protein